MNKKNKELMRTIKFTLFSISAGVIDGGSFALLNGVFHMIPWLATAISTTLSVIWNFTLNRKYTFQSANNIRKAMLQVALFYAVFIPLSSGWTDLLTKRWCQWDPNLVKFGITMPINFITEYLYQRFVVFRDSLDTAKK